MAREVAWLRAAVADLEEIGNYIGGDSPSCAKVVVNKLYDATLELQRFPHIGGAVPEWNDDRYRQRIVYSYRLIYRIISDERIEILTIIHGARLLPSDLRERR